MITIILAWRNLITRNRQSLILLLAISIGLFGLIFLQAFMDGFYVLMINTAIDTDLGYIQVHQKDFLLKRDVKLTIPGTDEILKEINTTPDVTGVSPRILGNGFFSSPESSNYGRIYGIDPRMEDSVTVISSKLVKGEKLLKDDEHKAFIGQALADKLKIDIGDKFVIQAKDVEGNMGGSAFRVKGTFRTASKDFDKSNVYITLEAARKMMALKDNVHEIAIRIDKQENLNETTDAITRKINNNKVSVQTWQQLQPTLKQMLKMSKQFTYIFYLIVYVALAFGIINAFLMEIFDRIREFGIMMALGTRPSRIFFVLLWESALLAIVSSFLGTAMALIFINYIMKNQMNLSFLGDGMAFLGLGNIIPLTITPGALIICILSTVVAVIAATIYPALRAAMFKPVEAMRYI